MLLRATLFFPLFFKKIVFAARAMRSAASLQGATAETVFVRTAEQEASQLRHSEQNWAVFIASRLPCRLQEGVTCGLVSLCMAADVLSPSHALSVSGLVDQAKKCGFSKQGEMFDASQMAQLARDYFGLQSVVLERWSCDALCAAVVSGKVALVAYDCAPNHEPTLCEGEKSHWCAVVGFVCPLTEDALVEEEALRKRRLQEIPNANVDDTDANSVAPLRVSEWAKRYGPGVHRINILQDAAAAEFGALRFVCVQPKSKRIGIWGCAELHASCNNLLHCHAREKEGDKIVPSDLRQTLAGRAVILSNPAL